MQWMGNTERFAAWCCCADPDQVERALRAIPAIYWPSVRGPLRAALADAGPFDPRLMRFDVVDDAMHAELSPDGQRQPDGQLSWLT